MFRANKFRKAWYMFFGRGNSLYLNTNLENEIKTAYEKNYTVFGAANKLASKAASIPIIAMKGDQESDIDPIKEIFKGRNTDYSLKEFRKHWHLFRYILGESMNYYQSIKGGNNAGKVFDMENLPVQNVDLIFGDYGDVIESYQITKNRKEESKIPADQVYHSRAFLNLDFEDGKQFRGIAPISVAADLIRAMNAGNKQVADLTEEGSPPFLLTNEDIDTVPDDEKLSRIQDKWRNYPKDVPYFGTGRMKKIDLGFSNLQDLQVLETDSRGLQAICNIWGVHVSLFSDAHATENNILTARKLMYEDRLIPDVEDEIEMYNFLFEPLGIHYEMDLSQIPALQEDKEKLAKVYALGIDKHAATYNEFRVNVLGLDPIDVPEMGEEGLIDRATFEPIMPTNFNNNNNEDNDNSNVRE